MTTWGMLVQKGGDGAENAQTKSTKPYYSSVYEEESLSSWSFSLSLPSLWKYLSTFQSVSPEWLWKFRCMFQVWPDGKKHGLWENPLCAAYKRRRGLKQLFTLLSSTCSLLKDLWTCLSLHRIMASSQKRCILLLIVVAAVWIQLHQGELNYYS